jgi:hypothetical protein
MEWLVRVTRMAWPGLALAGDGIPNGLCLQLAEAGAMTCSCLSGNNVFAIQPYIYKIRLIIHFSTFFQNPHPPQITSTAIKWALLSLTLRRRAPDFLWQRWRPAISTSLSIWDSIRNVLNCRCRKEEVVRNLPAPARQVAPLAKTFYSTRCHRLVGYKLVKDT